MTHPWYPDTAPSSGVIVIFTSRNVLVSEYWPKRHLFFVLSTPKMPSSPVQKKKSHPSKLKYKFVLLKFFKGSIGLSKSIKGYELNRIEYIIFLKK